LPAYLKTRFPIWLALPLPLVLMLAALRARSIDPAQAAIALGMALLLVLELRLWDDLCDVPLDRQTHPERVLCRTASLRTFWDLFSLLAAINLSLAWLLRGWWAAALLLGLHLLLAAWYGWRGTTNCQPVTNYHVVLLKYPIIVGVLGAATDTQFLSAPLALAASIVYLAMCILEVAHDARLRQLPTARICLAVESLLLAALGCWALSSAAWPSFWS
jgi:hypothetical protein